MRLIPSRFIIYCSLGVILFACTTASESPPANILNLIRLTPPTLLQFSEDLAPLKEIPLSLPEDCGLYDIFSPPRGTVLAVELSCSSGQTVLFLDTETGSVSQAYPQADSHFLAWASNSKGIFLRVDSFNAPRIVRVNASTLSPARIPISESTYDLASQPDSFDFSFTLSQGLGFGSELYLAMDDGRIVQLLSADRANYISFVRWSPDGEQIAFIKIPDSQVPFSVGELWMMNADGSNPGMLSSVDAGHGYAANWSPDGGQIAIVYRLNPDDNEANYSASALISDIRVIDVTDENVKFETHLINSSAETPQWSPDGKRLFFQRIVNGRMELEIADLFTGEVKPLLEEPACCLSWMRK